MSYQIYLPLEMIEHIFSQIRDTPTILNLRLLNKYFYKIFKQVPWYEKELYKGKYCFEEDHFTKFNLNDTLLRELKFKKWGRYVYREYKGLRMIKSIESEKLFKLKIMDYSNYSVITSTIYDAVDQEESIKKTPIVFPQCTIS